MSYLPFNFKVFFQKSIDSSFNLQSITIRKTYGLTLGLLDEAAILAVAVTFKLPLAKKMSKILLNLKNLSK
ncbi:hypothetical protein H6G32_24840 [Cylindrospermum sp. FACHB-282]|nr:hypothetical protein [Cylindrospermum sp. FACHB-282]